MRELRTLKKKCKQIIYKLYPHLKKIFVQLLSLLLSFSFHRLFGRFFCPFVSHCLTFFFNTVLWPYLYLFLSFFCDFCRFLSFFCLISVVLSSFLPSFRWLFYCRSVFGVFSFFWFLPSFWALFRHFSLTSFYYLILDCWLYKYES